MILDWTNMTTKFILLDTIPKIQKPKKIILDAIPIIHIFAKILDNIPKIFRWYSYHGLDANPMDVLDVIPVSRWVIVGL